MGVTVALRRAEGLSVKGKSKKKGHQGGKAVPAEAGRARYEITGLPTETAGRPLVHLDRELPHGGAEEYNEAHKRGVRSFAMWTDPYRKQLWARVVTASAGGGTVRHEVYGAAGELVGSVTRERSFTGGHVRTRWSAEQAGGPTAVGYKGRWFWWCVWWLILPAQCALGVLSLFEGGGDLFRMPRRIGYRSGGTRVLDYGSGFQDHFRLTAGTTDWDPRMLAALTALHSSHDGIMGDSWDKGALDEAAESGGVREPLPGGAKSFQGQP